MYDLARKGKATDEMAQKLRKKVKIFSVKAILYRPPHLVYGVCFYYYLNPLSPEFILQKLLYRVDFMSVRSLESSESYFVQWLRLWRSRERDKDLSHYVL